MYLPHNLKLVAQPFLRLTTAFLFFPTNKKPAKKQVLLGWGNLLVSY
jgi:hypothetical protein